MHRMHKATRKSSAGGNGARAWSFARETAARVSALPGARLPAGDDPERSGLYIHLNTSKRSIGCICLN